MQEAYPLGIEGQYTIKEYPKFTYVYIHNTLDSFKQALKNGRPRLIMQYERDYKTIHDYRIGFLDARRGMHIHRVRKEDTNRAESIIVEYESTNTHICSGFYYVDSKDGDIYEVYQSDGIHYIEEPSENWFREVSRIYLNLLGNRQVTLNRTFYREKCIFIDFQIDKIHIVTILNYRDSVYQKLSRLFNS